MSASSGGNRMERAVASRATSTSCHPSVSPVLARQAGTRVCSSSVSRRSCHRTNSASIGSITSRCHSDSTYPSCTTKVRTERHLWASGRVAEPILGDRSKDVQGRPTGRLCKRLDNRRREFRVCVGRSLRRVSNESSGDVREVCVLIRQDRFDGLDDEPLARQIPLPLARAHPHILPDLGRPRSKLDLIRMG
jgi:hypothetical protein